MKKIIFILIGLLFNLGCSKDDDLRNDSIVGKWEWIETSSAWTGIKYTPGSEGYTQTSIFRSDYTVEYYKNGELTNTETYRTKPAENSSQNSTTETRMILGVNNAEIPFVIHNDTLILSHAYVDGPTSIYVRVE